MSMTKGLDYVNELANGKQIYKEAKNLLEIYDFEYNCGGFALGIRDWYLPYADDGVYESKELDYCYYRYFADLHSTSGKQYAEACTVRGRIMVNFMVNTLGYVREIHYSSEVADDEYLVLFRASSDDFHFIRRMEDGSWAHKMGNSKIKTLTRKEIEPAWHATDNNYQGKVFLLAVKKQHDQPCEL